MAMILAYNVLVNRMPKTAGTDAKVALVKDLLLTLFYCYIPKVNVQLRVKRQK